jgi:2,3-bisphosphoglycerate-dependent phosphoglycerate mutase
MKTYIYLLRHGDSPKVGDERTRELTEKGVSDSKRIAQLLKSERIDAVISSPYKRSIQTVQQLAIELGQEILVIEELKERIFSAENSRLPDKAIYPLLERSFADSKYALKGGESNADCQKRAIKALKEILNTYRGKKVLLGTHGAIMTLMLRYYDNKYDLNFLLNTSKPDIYKMEFFGQELVDIQRLWTS